MDKLVKLLKENIGKEFRYVDLENKINGIIKEINIKRRVLILNDIEINLNKYIDVVLLKENFICFRGENKALLLISK